MTKTQKTCNHKFTRYSIAMIGMRWQCDKCDLIAPPCFEPNPDARSDWQKGFDAALNEVLDFMEID